jgi:hypothetical protein
MSSPLKRDSRQDKTGTEPHGQTDSKRSRMEHRQGGNCVLSFYKRVVSQSISSRGRISANVVSKL